jgi:hypothetical protein
MAVTSSEKVVATRCGAIKMQVPSKQSRATPRSQMCLRVRSVGICPFPKLEKRSNAL